MNILETKGLYHDFSPGGLELLFDINLQVKEREQHVIIGQPSLKRRNSSSLSFSTQKAEHFV